MSLDFKEFDSSDKLKEVIKSFFVINYDDEEKRKDFLLPNGTPSFFIIQSASGVEIRMMDSKNSQLLNEGIYIGYISNLVEYSHEKIRVIGASLYPMYMFLLFGITPKQLMNRFIKLEDFPELSLLNEVFQLEDLSEAEILVLIEQFVEARLKANAIREDLLDLFKRLTGPDGYKISVEKMASDMGFTRRHISDLFNKYFGMSPKQFVKLSRFNQGLNLITEMKSGDTYASIAQQLGYHDQAHFIRDFKSICGKTPSELKTLPESLAYQFRYFK
ncbi:helix-turn-helix domain-containing protein [Marinoscillum pacificum]|uniref:helix-turn-helix domain-containing protein n=1 Tax=Marinoscillum pacificum TaxID=392723 RepID=UPI0021588B7E|nr:helix-turn-helix domain-containing protein [Marinoscillum pacificum]